MPWGAPVDYDPFTQLAPAPEPPAAAPGFLDRMKSMVTGEGRTEFPDAAEFGQSWPPPAPPPDPSASADAPRPSFSVEGEPLVQGRRAMIASNVTPGEEAQFDILSKAIPGLERKTDKYGNLMLKAPGMSDFTYLNKPGLSTRDMTEFGVQTLATLPLMGVAAPVRGAGVLTNMVKGAAGLGGASLAQDVLATEAGSDQGIDAGRAELSAGVGAALPAAGALLKTGAGYASGLGRNISATVRGATNPREVARQEVQAAFNRDAANGGLAQTDRVATPADIPIASSRGQDLRTVDFGGENVLSEARKASNLSPSAKDSIMRVVAERKDGLRDRAVGMIENELGFSRSAETARADLAQQGRVARAPLYRQAFQAGKDGIDSPLLQQLQQSPIFQRAMGAAEHRLQDQAATPGWVTTGMKGKSGYTLEYWDQVKQTLDDYAGQAFRKGANGRGAQLSQMAKALRGELDAQGQAGKLYGQARGMAMQFFDAEDALDAGRKFATGSFNINDATQAVASLKPPEANLFAEGFADNYVRRVRANPSVLNSPVEQERAQIALGSQKYSQLEGFMRVENIMGRLKHAMGNSTTVRQLMEVGKAYGLQTAGGGLAYDGMQSGDPTEMIWGALLAGGRAGQLHINDKIAREVAQWLTSRDPDVFLKGMQAVGKAPFSDALRFFDRMLSEAGVAKPAATQSAINSRY